MEKPGTETTDSNEISDQEIADIYKEVDGDPDDNDISDRDEKEAADDSQPAEKQKEDEAADPDNPADETDGEPDKDASDPDQEPEVKEKVEDLKSEETRAKEIQEHAIKHGLTYAQAKEDLEKSEAVIKNYKTPLEMARALRLQTSEVDKLKNETKKSAVPAFQRMRDSDFLAADREKLDANKDKIVADARRLQPARTETMTDEAIIEEVAFKRLDAYKGWADRQEVELRDKASQLRDTLVKGIPEADQRFVPEIKAILAKTADQHVLSPDFDVRDLLWHAKGQRYDDDMAAEYKRGLKKGQEQPKIVGQILGSSGSGGVKPKGKGTPGSGLSDAQKARAEEMFPVERGYTVEDSYAEFRDTYKEELKKDPKFIY